MKTILKEIIFYETNKESQPYLDKEGRPFSRVQIKTEAHGKDRLSGFAYQQSPMRKWKVGDEIEIEIEEKQYKGKTYLNFKLPKSNSGAVTAYTVEKIDQLSKMYVALNDKVSMIEEQVARLLGEEKADEEVDIDLPF
jgi:hypothetical protein